MQLYFTWFIPQSALMFVTYLSAGMYMAFNELHFTRKRLIASLLIISVFFYEQLVVYPVSFTAVSYLISRVLFLLLLIFSSEECLRQFLKLIIQVTAWMILISLFFWILFLIGVPLPHYSTLTNNYYKHSVYFFFILNGDPGQLLPRFAGLFLEPGHLGSTACLLLFLNGVTLRKWQNVVFLVAVILSLSLAAYGLLVGSIALYLITSTRNGWLKMLPYIIVLAGVVAFFSGYRGGENAINQKILMRLVFENGEMVGNNRTSQVFDSQYNRFIKSKDAIFGMGRSVNENTHSSTGLLHGTASWKRYIFLRGYVGCALLLMFLFYYLHAYPSKLGLAFMIIYLVCNIIRDYPIDELWLYLVIASLPVYRQDKLSME